MVKKPMNYFDYAASSLIYPQVLDTLEKSQREHFANPSSLHILGHALHEKIVSFQEDFLKSIKASKNYSFTFTSSATESNNTVIRGLDFNPGDVIVYCPADHPSVVAPIEYLAESLKIELRKIVLKKDGSIDLENFESLLADPKIKLVTLTHVNNQSGVIHDIDFLSRKVKERTSAHVHIDAAQSFAKIKIIMPETVDSMSITSHKLGGPKGVAGLFLRNGHTVRPLLLGGGQQGGQRSSTEAFPLIEGFHAAMKISFSHLENVLERVSLFSEKTKSELIKTIPSIQTPFQSTSPYIFSFILPGISSDIILRHLEMCQVFISSTSACSSKIAGFNQSLEALNIPEKYHKNFLRISFGAETTLAQVDVLLKEFHATWETLKHMQKK